mmetsp:Transcript_4826/g.19298  ORF Transcript_4826/g.19298 Transcript_4826/m.19298 type:complete len:262 (-) Transcript_4826:723-1508(-)
MCGTAGRAPATLPASVTTLAASASLDHTRTCESAKPPATRCPSALIATTFRPSYVLQHVKNAQLGGARPLTRTRFRISAMLASSSSSRILGSGTFVSTFGALSNGPTRSSAASSPARFDSCWMSFLERLAAPNSRLKSAGWDISLDFAASTASSSRNFFSVTSSLCILAALSSTLVFWSAPQRTAFWFMSSWRWVVSPVSVTASAPKSAEPSSCSGAPATSVTPSRSLISPSSNSVFELCRKDSSSSHAYALSLTLDLFSR